LIKPKDEDLQELEEFSEKSFFYFLSKSCKIT